MVIPAIWTAVTCPISMVRMDEDFSRETLSRIKKGDDAAWRDLYARYRDVLLLSIRCRLGPQLRSRIESEDILQSVVKDAFLDLARFEPRGEHAIEHYLHVCVLNKIRSKASFFGAMKRQGDVPLTDTMADRIAGPAASEPEYHDAARFLRLEKGLSLLPENLREVILLRRVEGLSNQDAAKVLGKSPEATSKLHARAVAKLGSILGERQAE